MRNLFSNNYTLSKRALGILIIIVGAGGFLAILAIDLFDVGREGGIGPAQTVAMGGCICLVLIGLTLIPLGKAQA